MAGGKRWRAYPDHEVLIEDHVVGVVSRDAVVQAIMDGEAILHRMGGILTIVTGRTPTGFEGEAVTTGVIVEWKPAPAAKPKDEPVVAVVEPPVMNTDDNTDEEAAELFTAEPEEDNTSLEIVSR